METKTIKYRAPRQAVNEKKADRNFKKTKDLKGKYFGCATFKDLSLTNKTNKNHKTMLETKI